ncbi:uncharacterized protein LOC141637459 [Silene latifolia]|uniref:uncharacterized protein LOC141637459 n=1 Tax=Silene latifolia TaxID=37657 RepID=UPI003D76F24F
MAGNQEGLYYDYDVDSDGSLTRAIWTVGIARKNYSLFGDAVSFDPTYWTNKYSMTARHRFYMWHILKKVPCKFSVTRDDYHDFMILLNEIMWDEDLEAEEFDAQWIFMVQKHGIGDNDWHLIWIYSSNGVKSILDAYIAKRWTKDATRYRIFNYDGEGTEHIDIIGGMQLSMSAMWSEFHQTISILHLKDKAYVSASPL